jgi:Ca2+-binding RTX toxin-like protein
MIEDEGSGLSGSLRMTGAAKSLFVFGGNNLEVIGENQRGTLSVLSKDADFLKVAGGDQSQSIIVKGAARAEISGGGGNDIIFGGNGNDDIFGGAGNDIITGSGGRDVMRGNGGRDTFTFFEGNGIDVIKDFEIGKDTIELNGFDRFRKFEDLNILDQGGYAVIKLEGKDKIILQKIVDAADLSNDDFAFV